MAFDLLLIGAGHSHLGVLRRWAQGRRPRGRLGLVSAGPQAWYSGLLPGLLAGRYQPQDCRIELAPLCAAAGVELILGEVKELQPDRRELCLDNGERLQASWLSLNVGAGLITPPQQGEGMQLLPVKPFERFLEGWRQWQQEPQPLALLGGGAAGVELALAIAGQVPSLALFSAGPLLAGYAPGLRLRAIGLLRQRGVFVREHCPISAIDGQTLLSVEGPVWQGARTILASGPAALPWLAASGLDCDEDGFVRVRSSLQSQSHPQIFAVGDCASLPGVRRSASYALRQSPVLTYNLAAALRGEPMKAYRPQRPSLSLLATGDGGALLGWHDWSAGGLLCGYWKDRLDRRFIRRHRLAG